MQGSILGQQRLIQRFLLVLVLILLQCFAPGRMKAASAVTPEHIQVHSPGRHFWVQAGLDTVPSFYSTNSAFTFMGWKFSAEGGHLIKLELTEGIQAVSWQVDNHFSAALSANPTPLHLSPRLLHPHSALDTVNIARWLLPSARTSPALLGPPVIGITGFPFTHTPWAAMHKMPPASITSRSPSLGWSQNLLMAAGLIAARSGGSRDGPADHTSILNPNPSTAGKGN